MITNKTTNFPATRAVCRFLWSRKMIYTTAVTATVITALWQVENHRGHQRWAEVSAQIAATGDNLHWDSPIPAPVPDELNAARHPVFAPAFVPDDADFGYYLDFSNLLPQTIDTIPENAEPQEILDATASFGDLLAGLHEAFQRPHCYYFTFDPPAGLDPIDYPVPCIASATTTINNFLDLASLRTDAHLSLGDPATAAREIATIVKFARSTESDTTLVGALVETAALQLTVPRLAVLVTRSGWDDEALATVADSLAGIRLLDKIDAGLRRERAASVNFILSSDLDLVHPEMQLTSRVLASIAPYAPNGWRQQNAANLALWWEQSAFTLYDRSTGRLNPGSSPSMRELLSGPVTPYTYLVRTACPSIGSIYREAATTQTSAALLQLLCAIERHHLEHGQRPASLIELVPHFITAIPVDPVTALPPHYAADKNDNLTLATLDWHRTTNPGTFEAVITTGPAPTQLSRNK